MSFSFAALLLVEDVPYVVRYIRRGVRLSGYAEIHTDF